MINNCHSILTFLIEKKMKNQKGKIIAYLTKKIHFLGEKFQLSDFSMTFLEKENSWFSMCATKTIRKR